MKKLIVVMLALLMLVGCTNKANKTSDVYYRFMDSNGHEVVLEKKPENVAVLFSSYAQLWQLAKGEVNITVGDSVKRGFAQDPILVNDTMGMKIDVETLLAAEPDFVIVSADLAGQVSAAQMAREAGIPVAEMREESFEDYLTLLKIFTDINECSDIYEKYGLGLQKEINELLTDVKNKNYPDLTYLFIRAGNGANSTKAKTASDHFGCVMVDELGATNIVEDGSLLTESLSLEQILISEPDVILITLQGDENASKAYVEDLFAEDGWKDVKAIRENHYYFISKELFNYKPNQNWLTAYRELIKVLYEN